ncbi:hypothetical protein PGB90_008331 [Kerria lacca]
MFNNDEPKIKGIKKLFIKNQTIISSGLPSLDSIIGGGIPLGSYFLLEEDEYGVYSNIILKHFLAEGIINDHALLLGGQSVDSRKFIFDLPSPLHFHDTNNLNSGQTNNNEDSLRIAWRYQNLPNDTINLNTSIFGNTYDMSTKIKKCVIEKALIYHWNSYCVEFSYEKLFAYIKNVIEESQCSTYAPVPNRTVLRIALFSLGTALWKGNLIKFLIKLRFLLRNSCASCFITLPTHLLKDLKILHRCEHLCDTVVQLKSLINNGNMAYSDYQGLVILKKLPIINTWTFSVPESNDYAFKIKKKHFIIEKLHISPEFKEKVHREEEDVSEEYKTTQIISNISHLF